MSNISEEMDAQDAAARRLCAEQPSQSHVRKALRDAEKQVHVEEGWDAPLRVFSLEQHTRNHRINYVPQPQVTGLVRDISEQRDIRPPEVLEMLADAVEHARAQVDGVAPSTMPQPADPVLFEFVRTKMLSRRIPGGDLVATQPSYRFHGIGLLMEGWFTTADEDTDLPTLMEAGRQHKIYTLPKRLEVRQIHYSARDGFCWEVMRFRRVPNVALPRFCMAHDPESNFRFDGGIPESMSRMCNAICSTPVPIRRYEEDKLP